MDASDKDIIAIRRLLTYFAGLSILYLLYLLQQVLIPFVLALFIALLVYPVLEFFDKKKVPIWLSITMIWIVIIASIFLLGWVFYSTGLSFYEQRDVLFLQLQNKLNTIIDYMNSQYQLQIDISDVMMRIQERLNSSFLIAQTTNFAGTLGGVIGVFSMVALYLIILMSGILSYENYFRYLEQDKKQGRILQAFETVKKSITTYMRVKFILSVCTGIGTALVCSLLHIKFAIFWGFLAYLLNFIPTFGSILGVVPPVLMSLIQFDSMMYVFLVLVLLFAVQTLFGNILEPIYMGSSVAINTIAIIMGLLFWGYLWGVYGMFLAVPLLVMVKTMLEQIEGAEVLARLMGTHVKVKKKT